jgi:DNA polymerase/3'-5' exonuclease PolX
MTRIEARALADKVIEKLKPFVERGLICGSYRRGQQDVGDLDIVVIAKTQNLKDMFGEVVETVAVSGFCDAINSWEKIKGSPTGKYCQRIIDGHKVEISIATKNNWGCLTMIRTGSKEFSHLMMKRALKVGLEQRDGYLYNGTKMIPVYEEKDYFTFLNLPYIEPHKRDEHAFRNLTR